MIWEETKVKWVVAILLLREELYLSSVSVWYVFIIWSMQKSSSCWTAQHYVLMDMEAQVLDMFLYVVSYDVLSSVNWVSP